MILLDVAASTREIPRPPRFAEVERLAGQMFCPVTIGGGVKRWQDARELLRRGADKIAINTFAVMMPNIIGEIAERFGSQACVVSIDVKAGKVWTHCGSRPTQLDPVEWAERVTALGAGEILLNSIERDGTMQGYDLDLIAKVSRSISVPVVACGGCGSYEHMQQALAAGAHAVASGAMFQFCETTPKDAARYLKAQGFSTRI